ncbi:hypothetical protein BKA82DRAFT_35621 [Pisolithus tinctorius]|uniref:Uncharacterized protein n=1 Tax=Pisolithus tinctorius Marx 270 TaxID=870435 RepID=A0A0C3NDQ2_PISTI|nr:hypothetical protein BKA82DRAFT_35621 [Pisolithus tinctorius]KIN93900.1 hypothetical protein M404DRAFT_35621 [Pisolithus tinctorius Marx 270]
MAPRRKTEYMLTSEDDEAYITADSSMQDELEDELADEKTITLDAAPILSLPTFPRPLRVHPVSRVACMPSGSGAGEMCTEPDRSTGKPSNDVEEIPVTRSDLQLFKEMIQLELDDAVNAINEAANTVKAHFAGTALGACGNSKDQETLPLFQGHRKVKGLPAHRRPADLEFQRLIREHALALMKHENKHSSFTNVPNRAEAAAYTKGTQRPCCTTVKYGFTLR